MSSWRREQWVLVKRKMKKFWESGARKILSIVVPWGMLVTSTGWLSFILLRFMCIFYVLFPEMYQNGFAIQKIVNIWSILVYARSPSLSIFRCFIAVKFGGMLNKWVFVLLLVEMTCFSSADVLLLHFSSMQLWSSLREHTGIKCKLDTNDVEMHLADLIVPLLFMPFNEVNITFEDVPVVWWLVTTMLYSQLDFPCLPD